MTTYIMPVSYLRKLSHREVMGLAQQQAARTWKNQEWTVESGTLTESSAPFTTVQFASSRDHGTGFLSADCFRKCQNYRALGTLSSF